MKILSFWEAGSGLRMGCRGEEEKEGRGDIKRNELGEKERKDREREKETHDLSEPFWLCCSIDVVVLTNIPQRYPPLLRLLSTL